MIKNNIILIKLKNSMKKMIKIAFVAAFVAIAGYGVYTNQKAETMSDLMLANVEALAWPEGSSPYRVFPCPSSSGNECKTSNDANRNECYNLSYCR